MTRWLTCGCECVHPFYMKGVKESQKHVSCIRMFHGGLFWDHASKQIFSPSRSQSSQSTKYEHPLALQWVFVGITFDAKEVNMSTWIDALWRFRPWCFRPASVWKCLGILSGKRVVPTSSNFQLNDIPIVDSWNPAPIGIYQTLSLSITHQKVAFHFWVNKYFTLKAQGFPSPFAVLSLGLASCFTVGAPKRVKGSTLSQLLYSGGKSME